MQCLLCGLESLAGALREVLSIDEGGWAARVEALDVMAEKKSQD